MKDVRLFDYQRMLRDRMVHNQAYALWLRPGLGKTLTTLSALHELREQGLTGHILLIAPLAVVRATWEAEIEKWGMGDEVNRIYLSIDLATGRTLRQGLRYDNYRALVNEPDSLLLINQDNVTDMVDFFTDPPALVRRPRRADADSVREHVGRAGLSARVLNGLLGHYGARTLDGLDPSHYREFQWRVDRKAAERIKPPPWPAPTLIIDEAQGFKTPSSARTQALLRLRRRGLANRIYELTGSPEPSSVEDLWSQVTIMDGGATLGATVSRFRDRYMEPDPDIKHKWNPRPGAQEAVNARVRPYAMSMSDPGLKLPPLTIDDVSIDLGGRVMADYRRFRRQSLIQLADGRVITAANAGVLLNKLLQFASGTVYPEPGSPEYVVVHRAKLDVLADLLYNMDTPVLIGYWYRSDREEILKRFGPDSDTPVVPFTGTREEQRRWNAGDIPAALTSPASMAYGVNLQDGPGHTLVYYTLPPGNLSQYDQFIRRIYRMGQGEPTVVHRLLAKGTADERVAALLQEKAGNQRSLMAANDAGARLAAQAVADEIGGEGFTVAQ